MNSWKTLFKSFLMKLRLPDFTRIDNETVLLPIDKDTFKFVEGERSVLINVERLAGDPSMVIYAGLLKQWSSPHEQQDITAEDKDRILNKICYFFDQRGWSYEVDNS